MNSKEMVGRPNAKQSRTVRAMLSSVVSGP
jgi:hypothetical protein